MFGECCATFNEESGNSLGTVARPFYKSRALPLCLPVGHDEFQGIEHVPELRAGSENNAGVGDAACVHLLLGFVPLAADTDPEIAQVAQPHDLAVGQLAGYDLDETFQYPGYVDVTDGTDHFDQL